MKQWSVAMVAVVVLSLLTWLAIYRYDGAPPTPGITVMLVGLWLAIVLGAMRWFKR